MRPHWTIAAALSQFILAFGVFAQGGGRAQGAAERTFDFTYAGSINGLTPGDQTRIWLPLPPDNADQHVVRLRQSLPGRVTEGTDSNGNRVLSFLAPATEDGTISFSVVYHVTRHEIDHQPAEDSPDERYLKPDRLVPVGGKPAALLTDLSLPQDGLAKARLLYDLVDRRMQYRKDQPGWGRGDATWACESGFGNCTDFHSLFISLARSSGLPAKFEIGFGLPEEDKPADVPGYHCWAFFRPAGGDWLPVDISEANKHPEKTDYFFGKLCQNRVTFSSGRDILLEPKQAGEPLNFFVYPYAEVNGKPVPAAQIKKAFHVDPAKP
jgi:transglutaminase-like putative cysteine protease